jgi:hypothetical protein
MLAPRFLVAAAFAAFAFSAIAHAAQSPAAITTHAFGTVSQGELVEHDFVLANESDAAMRITGVQLSPPLTLARMPAVVPPYGQVTLKVKLDTSKVHGEYEGLVRVALGGDERVFSLDGRIVAPIEVLPRPAFFIATTKGTAKSSSLEIVNRESAPVTLELPPGAPFDAKLETVEPGRRFRLSVSVPENAQAGRMSQRLELKTSSARSPVLRIAVNTMVRERVYTFPDSVDLGAGGAQTLMVYQTGGHDFAVETRTDVPGLSVAAERGPQGDRVQLTIDAAQPGPVHGTLYVRTNDPEFPELKVPVVGGARDRK